MQYSLNLEKSVTIQLHLLLAILMGCYLSLTTIDLLFFCIIYLFTSLRYLFTLFVYLFLSG